jgi:hypothetical protein
MRRSFGFVTLLLTLAAGPAQAVEYRLQVGNLYRDAFVHYLDGPLGTGSGEFAMDRLEDARRG